MENVRDDLGSRCLEARLGMGAAALQALRLQAQHGRCTWDAPEGDLDAGGGKPGAVVLKSLCLQSKIS